MLCQAELSISVRFMTVVQSPFDKGNRWFGLLTLEDEDKNLTEETVQRLPTVEEVLHQMERQVIPRPL